MELLEQWRSMAAVQSNEEKTSLRDTNVKSFQCGRGAAEKLSLGRFIVFTMPVP